MHMCQRSSTSLAFYIMERVKMEPGDSYYYLIIQARLGSWRAFPIVVGKGVAPQMSLQSDGEWLVLRNLQ